MDLRSPEVIKRELSKFTTWYHKINLGNGIVTPGRDYDALWENIRTSRNYINYKDKNVIDLGSWDGMWAFEAEEMGANIVVATDSRYEAYENFLFCREVLGSKVIPFYNVVPFNLAERLDVFFQENWRNQKPYERLFDIVQHLGLLYHVRDPLITLSQSRSCLRSGGYLLIETGAVTNDDASYMLFNGTPSDGFRIYDDVTTWWAPTIPCLKEMLKASLFEPIEESISIWKQSEKYADCRHEISRVALVARAVPPEDVDPQYYRELERTYRNPGLKTDLLTK